MELMDTMTAPINDSSEGTKETEKKKATVRILIADDHPIVRDGLKKLLLLEDDFEIVGEAGDGREVLEKVQELDPDVLLLDLRMPNLDGLSALQALQQTNKRTRVIVLTASEDKNEFVQAMKLGCSGIVLKQTAPDLIVKSIRKVNAGEIWLDSHTTAAVMRQFQTGTGRQRPGRLRRQGPRAQPADRARTRNRRAGRAGLQEQGNGREDVHQRADGEEPSAQHLRQAGRFRPSGTGALRHPQGPAPGGRAIGEIIAGRATAA